MRFRIKHNDSFEESYQVVELNNKHENGSKLGLQNIVIIKSSK